MRVFSRLSPALLLASVSAFAAEEAVILTPKPGPAPRINCARVFGVRPVSPFLFTVAAAGERPIRFGAEGLPSGLRLDPATGRIGGSVAVSGTHAVTLAATNRHGTSTRPFKVVVGDTPFRCRNAESGRGGPQGCALPLEARRQFSKSPPSRW